MGTTIKINDWRGEKTTPEQWDALQEYFVNTFNDADITEHDCLSSGLIYCSYGNANLNSQFNEDIKELLKNSGVELCLWYEEREPDEILEFDEVEE